MTYIDFAAAFDSVSHKFLDEALANAGAKRKTRALLRAIYSAAQGAVQIRDESGNITLSQAFDVRRGVVQGDIISPILFILALDQMVQEADTEGQGVCVGEIKELRVLGYADDAAMASVTVEEMTERLTKFADAALARADMKTKLSKTWTQHVSRQEKQEPATAEEIAAKEASYKHPCYFERDGCTARFKTKQGMLTHTTTCPFNYANSSKYFEVEEVRAVYGKASRKLFFVKWEGYPETENSWVPEGSLLRDGCKESIDDFWLKSGINPAKDFYPDPEARPRCWMCGYACSNPAMRFLKAHLTVHGHN